MGRKPTGRPRGRPKSDNPRTNRLDVFVTDAAHAVIAELAEAEGCTLGTAAARIIERSARARRAKQ